MLFADALQTPRQYPVDTRRRPADAPRTPRGSPAEPPMDTIINRHNSELDLFLKEFVQLEIAFQFRFWVLNRNGALKLN